MSKIFIADKLKIRGNKTLSTIALILMLTFAAFMAALPAAKAHTPAWTISTYAFLSVAPNPVGVGQTAYVNFWLDKVPPTAEGNWGMMWHNFTVTVTKPDGTTVKLGPYSSDAVGGAWTQYVPTQTGTYKFVFNFPGQTVVNENPYPYLNASLQTAGNFLVSYDFINDTYTASTSKEVTLTVQQQPIQPLPINPLPTGYWQRPINSMNREWYSIGGNWLGATFDTYSLGNFHPYTTGPNSAHVLWTKPIAFGGQIGGEFGASETGLYATGTAYESKFKPVVINGILYYTLYPGSMVNPAGLTAVDIRTGQTLWTKNITIPLNIGQIQQFITGDQYGGHAYLWTAPVATGFILPPAPANVWSMYDAMTGNWILNIANVTAGTLVEGPNGEMLSYLVAGGKLTMWNSSLCIAAGSTLNEIYQVYSSAEIWRPPQGATIDWSPGNQWTVPIATSISGAPISPPLSLSKIDQANNVILMTSSDTNVPGGSQKGWRTDAGYSAKTGQLLWGPINRTLTPWTTLTLGPAGYGVYTVNDRQTLTWSGYSILTGEKLWGPTASYNGSWGYYTSSAIIGYGNLYVWTLGGEVYCYDVKTGALEWSWNAGSAGYNTPYGVWPFWTGAGVVADGKIYVTSSHDYTPPVYEGAKMYCLNATTGEEIWSTLHFGGTQGNTRPIADGILVSFNVYDNQIYAFGMGQSATTVSASPITLANGDTTTIQGTVTDQSPGQTSLGIPAAGTPAISDASMSQWMEYLYQQQPKPTNATGVPVTLTALDPNGNTEVIGTVTSDAAGMYKAMWTPPVPGAYTIIASFAGTNSYYASSAETAIGVTKAPAAQVPVTTPAPVATPLPTVTPLPTATPSPQVTATPIPAPSSPGIPTTYIIIAIVAIIIVVAAAALALRRRK